MRREVGGAAAVVFIASFCTLVIELVAGRILAPYVGVSLYTWTSIIGVVLAGISIGAWVGGTLADRYAATRLLPLLVLLAAASSLAIVPLASLPGSTTLALPDSLMLRVLLLAFVIFFLPSCILATISPVAIKIALRDLGQTGHIVGRIYAVSTLGSILGTFATGFFLIAHFGTRAILVGMALILAICAVAIAAVVRHRALLVVAIVPAFVAVAGARFGFLRPSFADNNKYATETNYYTVRVDERTRIDGSGKLQTLILDQLIHSVNDIDHPCYLAYGYLRIFDEVMRARAGDGRPVALLFLGGGGYTLPRCAETVFPNGTIDVVEIDPAVTAVAYRFLGLSLRTRIRTINSDARWYLLRSDRKYDVIFSDAFNDLSIPYHLTTREFLRLQKSHLAPGGVLAANVIDNVPAGDFFPSYLRTVEEVFGAANTVVFADRENYSRGAQSTVVIVAGARPQIQAMTVPGADVNDAFRRGRWTQLTDDYAPVDNLLAPLFAERARYQRR
jgi:predicted membrane-bound spermidine synthase